MKAKGAVVARVARSAALFYPECQDCFICPTCLGRLPVSDAGQITVAHILPRSPGGGLKTLLCANCNSTFGTRQDRWMGEFLRLAKTKSTMLKDGTQQGHFEIDGVRVSGRYRVRDGGGLDLFVWKNKTSPTALQTLDARFAEFHSRGKNISITIPLPLLANKRLVSIGFLTAAYLLWFKELGYSWALQNHLDPVRRQIRNPEDTVLPENFCVWCKDAPFTAPWIGVGRVQDEIALMAGIEERIVFLPPADRPDEFYSLIPTDFSNIEIHDIRPLRFYRQHAFEGPLGIIFGDRLLVAPDVALTRPSSRTAMIFIPPDGGPIQLLHPLTREQCDNLSRDARAVKIQVTRVVDPGHEIGRP